MSLRRELPRCAPKGSGFDTGVWALQSLRGKTSNLVCLRTYLMQEHNPLFEMARGWNGDMGFPMLKHVDIQP